MPIRRRPVRRPTRRRNPDPPISDEVMQAAWDDAYASARDNARATVSEMGYRRMNGEYHPDFEDFVLSALEDSRQARDYIRETNAEYVVERQRFDGNSCRSVEVKRLPQLSYEEDQYIAEWWERRLAQEHAEVMVSWREELKRRVYIDQYPNAPHSVDRRDIGDPDGEYADYIVVPAGDRANPSRERITSADVAVPRRMLSAADIARLQKLAAKAQPKKPRSRR